MVTIGIDARFYGTENTGLGRYTKNVLLPLTKLLPGHKLVVFLRNPYFDSLKLGREVEKVRCNLPHYSLTEQLSLPRLIKQHKIDLWFSFHFNTPIFSHIPKITVIHDLIKTYSTGRDTTTRSPWLYQLKRWGYNRVMRSTVLDSREIIVPTNTVKNDILALYQERPEKIHPIWEAPDPSLSQDNSSFKIHDTYQNLPNKFILYVGNAYPHKNLKTLLSALKNLKTKHLVIVASNTPYLKKLMSNLSKKVRERITILNSLTDQELGYLYQHAEMLIAPSLMEGFGLPGLEALVVGTPVIASDIPVFREVYGAHATYFDPNSSRDLTRAVRANPRIRPLQYPRTWTNVATDIAEVIHESCNSL